MPAGISDLWADEWAVNKILFNLLSNAIKFTPAGGTVSLRAQVAASGINLIVTDTGLGLALVRGLVTLNRGRFLHKDILRDWAGVVMAEYILPRTLAAHLQGGVECLNNASK